MIKKKVVVSSNNNPDYLFYLPYIERAWNKLGWDLIVMITDDVDAMKLKCKTSDICVIPNIEGMRRETQAQVGRLYASKYMNVNTLIMTSDMDLLPLSDYWNPNPNDITIFGHDLTWRSFYPMGYIAMTGKKWQEKLNLDLTVKECMARDMNDKNVPHSALSKEWEQWWNYDWSLVTHRLKHFEKELTFIDRGQINIAGATLAKGRIDRYSWEATQNQAGPFIDAHCENCNVQQQDKLNKFLKVFEQFFGKL